MILKNVLTKKVLFCQNLRTYHRMKIIMTSHGHLDLRFTRIRKIRVKSSGIFCIRISPDQPGILIMTHNNALPLDGVVDVPKEDPESRYQRINHIYGILKMLLKKEDVDNMIMLFQMSLALDRYIHSEFTLAPKTFLEFEYRHNKFSIFDKNFGSLEKIKIGAIKLFRTFPERCPNFVVTPIGPNTWLSGFGKQFKKNSKINWNLK